jgi:hypothetical protein
MNMNRRFLTVIVISFFTQGCFDIFTGKEKHIIGDISVINPDNVEDKGYRMVIYENEYNSNMLDDYVIDVNGNDSVMLVKCIDKKECNELYYKINHNKGRKPLSVVKINYGAYSGLMSALDGEYDFSDHLN